MIQLDTESKVAINLFNGYEGRSKNLSFFIVNIQGYICLSELSRLVDDALVF